MQLKHSAAIPMPDLYCVDTVPMTALMGFKEKIDCSACRPGLFAASPGFCVPSTFRVRFHVEGGDDVVWRHDCCRQVAEL